MFALTLFVLFFCFASCCLYQPSNKSCLVSGEAQDSDMPENLTDIFQGLYEAYIGESDEVEVVDDVEAEVSQITSVETSEDTAKTDGYTWETFEDLSLTALRKVAKTLGIPRYTRLDRDELVFEINTRRKAVNDDYDPANLQFIQ